MNITMYRYTGRREGQRKKNTKMGEGREKK
jgi:hypothetical protein